MPTDAIAPLVGVRPDDERFARNGSRVAHRGELLEAITKAFAERPAEDWTAALAEAGVPAGVVNTLDQVYDSARVAAEDLVLEVEHPSLGAIRLPGRPLKFSRGAPPAPLPPPLLAQHDDDIRQHLRDGGQS